MSYAFSLPRMDGVVVGRFCLPCSCWCSLLFPLFFFLYNCDCDSERARNLGCARAVYKISFPFPFFSLSFPSLLFLLAAGTKEERVYPGKASYSRSIGPYAPQSSC